MLVANTQWDLVPHWIDRILEKYKDKALLTIQAGFVRMI